MTLRELTEALYATAADHQRPGLDPDMAQAHPTDHPFCHQLELARKHLTVALQIARLAVKPPLRVVAARDGSKEGA